MTKNKLKTQTKSPRDKHFDRLITAYRKVNTKLQNIARRIQEEIENDDIFWNLTAHTQSYNF